MRKTKISVIALLFLLGFTSCNKWLDIKPADRVVEEHVFNTEAGVISALNGVYGELNKSELYGLTLGSEFIEILAQQYNIRSANTNYTEVSNYGYTMSYSKGRLEAVWDNAYKAILNCNKIIENIESKKDLFPSKFHELIIGESLALRSFLHFDILRLFGPIYATSPDRISIPYINRISVSPSPLLPADQVALRILEDLDEAERHLKNADPIIEEGPQNTEVEGADDTYRYRTLRFNYYAVLALKARIYLYIGDKTNALKYAKKIIDDPNRESFFPFVHHTEILSNAANPDRMFSTEVIFGMHNTGRNTIFQNYFNPDAAQAANLLIPRPGNITALFSGEDSDYRNFPFWKTSNLEVNAVYTMKYRAGETPTLYRNSLMPLIRLGEMYLIAAETETNETQAYMHLNKLRNQRGLANVSSDLQTHIRNEYIKEFYGEGQLFFYYKRNNIATIRSGITNNNISMTEARYVPLLPDSENRYRD